MVGHYQDLLEKVLIIAPRALDTKVSKWVSELLELRYFRLDLTGQSMSGVGIFFDETVPNFGWSAPSSKWSSDSRVFTEFDSTEVSHLV
jgi:hypothetical protein